MNFLVALLCNEDGLRRHKKAEDCSARRIRRATVPLRNSALSTSGRTRSFPGAASAPPNSLAFAAGTTRIFRGAFAARRNSRSLFRGAEVALSIRLPFFRGAPPALRNIGALSAGSAAFFRWAAIARRILLTPPASGMAFGSGVLPFAGARLTLLPVTRSILPVALPFPSLARSLSSVTSRARPSNGQAEGLASPPAGSFPFFLRFLYVRRRRMLKAVSCSLRLPSCPRRT